MPGANGQNETIEETIEDLKSAIEDALGFMREEGASNASDRAQQAVVTVVA